LKRIVRYMTIRHHNPRGMGSSRQNAVMARLCDVVVDCERPASLARFWAATLDGYEVVAYDEDEVVRLRSIGVEDTEDDPSVLVESPESRVRFWFQRVPERKVVKNRVHLDLTSVDADGEATRLVALGARVHDDQPNEGLLVLSDPEGNEFCLLRSSPRSP